MNDVYDDLWNALKLISIFFLALGCCFGWIILCMYIGALVVNGLGMLIGCILGLFTLLWFLAFMAQRYD